MEEVKEYSVICHFCAIARKRIKAHSFEEAVEIAETDGSVNFNEIIKITEPCKVDEVVIREYGDQSRHAENVEYKSWGSE